MKLLVVRILCVLDGEKKVVNVLICIFAVGSLALWLADYSFPPVEQTKLLLGMIAVWFVGAAILSWAKKNDDGDDTDSFFPKKLYLAIAFVPWLVCAVVVANAVVDSSTASAHTTSVTKRSTGRYGSSVNVASWGSEGNTGRVPVSDSCYNLLTPGKNITVVEKDGPLGIHWIAGIAECSRSGESRRSIYRIGIGGAEDLTGSHASSGNKSPVQESCREVVL